ncbi:uncharacterized protein B0H18DRAFT_1018074 [Fomitopsis serialis]|uniref:uncharacterized protein n=1 Tax=Fomitopsis serialis TaxID=139415 RepID=UPI002008CF36|nr:uncharacterized protein B0H18DRAFT_1018074 [Neoantrodia serialis]KAH9922539.1 hypothetical protein B0H18DRAFT_1018074 [Neoantrodia serialis]
MSADSGMPHQQQKDIIQSFFQFDAARDAAERFYSRSSGPQTPGNFSSQPSLPPMPTGMHFGSDALQHMMPSMDTSAQQQGVQQSSQPTPQALLEQQFRLNQLQQLQQLQNQIFQQQLELLSSQNAFGGGQTLAGQAMGDRQREQQQYGLPTPGPSGELRAQQSPDFVSPLLLQSGAGLSTMAQQPHSLSPDVCNIPGFLSQSHQMIPSGPHSAPAHIAFEISPPLSMPSGSSGADHDFNDISPLTSPWLGPFNNAQAMQGSSGSGSAAGLKRRGASSSGDEETSVPRPSRKRQSSIRAAARPGPNAQQKRTSMRGSRSANSTPLFNGMARPGMGLDMSDMNELPGDSPSPIELPPMPPPAHPPQPPSSLEREMTSAATSASAMGVPSHNAASAPAMTPVTPASIMNLGRLGINSGLAPPSGAQDQGATKKKDGSGRARASSKSANFAEPGRTTRSTDKSTSVPLVSPNLKPIRPAGNQAVVSTSPSPSTTQPIVQFRKSSHKAAEQKRRDSLKTTFDDLRLLLPPIPLPAEDEPILPGAMPPRGPPKGNSEGPNRAVSKLQLLRCGNEYIKILKGRVDRRDEEIERLRSEVARLRLVVGPEAENGEEEVDLERDVDAVEAAGGGVGLLLGRAYHGREGSLAEVEEADEEGGDS